MRDLARQAERDGAALTERYWIYARTWFWLGVPAFTSVMIIFCLMVMQPG